MPKFIVRVKNEEHAKNRSSEESHKSVIIMDFSSQTITMTKYMPPGLFQAPASPLPTHPITHTFLAGGAY